MDDRQVVGRQAEDAVAIEMERRGYRVVARNARARCGEIDLVVRRGREVVAVEVRSRRTGDGDDAADSIQAGKRGRVRRTMAFWLAFRPEDYDEVRFFVATVAWRGADPSIVVLEDAF